MVGIYALVWLVDLFVREHARFTSSYWTHGIVDAAARACTAACTSQYCMYNSSPCQSWIIGDGRVSSGFQIRGCPIMNGPE